MYTRSRYKQCTPEITINRIKDILSSIKIEIEEEWFHNIGGVDSCRIRIINKGLRQFDIGTNGKGMTREYALASAYAEFMERLQNKTMFREGLKYASPYLRKQVTEEFLNKLKYEGLLLDFLYFPDEKLHENVIHTPFKEIITNKVIDFPIGLFRAMCGTTGLCAGNTPEEAICQGLNEIMERYVLWHIFNTNIAPQHFIPLCNFKNHEIYDKLLILGGEYEISIHNWAPQCHGMPVIGLLLLRKNDGSYTYRLGADFNAITALERCYTEIFQGENVLKALLKKPQNNYKTTLDDYYKCRHNGTGTFPIALTSTYNTKEYIDFPHHDFKTYEEELYYYKGFIKSLGKQIFIKDNSFLNFPAYSVYIPDISNPFAIDGSKCYSDWQSLRMDEYNYIEGRYNLIENLQNGKCDPISSHRIEDAVIRLNPWNDARNNYFYYYLAESLRFMSLKKWKDAALFISKLIEYLRSQNCQDDSKIVMSYQRLLEILIKIGENVLPQNINAEDKLTSSLVNMILDPVRSLKGMKIPTCFNCSECHIKDNCHFFDIISLEKAIQEKQISLKNESNMV